MKFQGSSLAMVPSKVLNWILYSLFSILFLLSNLSSSPAPYSPRCTRLQASYKVDPPVCMHEHLDVFLQFWIVGDLRTEKGLNIEILKNYEESCGQVFIIVRSKQRSGTKERMEKVQGNRMDGGGREESKREEGRKEQKVWQTYVSLREWIRVPSLTCVLVHSFQFSLSLRHQFVTSRSQTWTLQY